MRTIFTKKLVQTGFYIIGTSVMKELISTTASCLLQECWCFMHLYLMIYRAEFMISLVVLVQLILPFQLFFEFLRLGVIALHTFQRRGLDLLVIRKTNCSLLLFSLYMSIYCFKNDFFWFNLFRFTYILHILTS